MPSDNRQDALTEQWTHAGLDCKLVRTDIGHWCGYVRRPDTLNGAVRWRGTYDEKLGMLESDVDVWGGITYGPDDDGWVGFDDAHPRDLAEHRDTLTDRAAVRAETEDLAEQIAGLVEADDS